MGLLGKVLKPAKKVVDVWKKPFDVAKDTLKNGLGGKVKGGQYASSVAENTAPVSDTNYITTIVIVAAIVAVVVIVTGKRK